MAGKRRAPDVSVLLQMPGHLIRRAQQLSNAIFAEECGRYDLTSVQFAALFAVRAAGRVDLTRLAEQIAFDRATIGDVVDRLETKGWVTRTGSPTDRRVKLICLTPEGARLLAEVEPAVARVQARLFAVFSAEERPMVMAFLKRLDRVQDPLLTTAPPVRGS